jgi:radical SAM superfamily enzyme YgiQ (UPF0313 family)
MKILFSNPPWWVGREKKWGVFPLWRSGVRAGSRWPFTSLTFSFPGWHQPFEYLPLPMFMAYAAGYAAKESGTEVLLRDSIARRESYAAYFSHLEQLQADYVVLESATPSWSHDAELIRKIHERCPGTQIILTGPITVTDPEKILSSLPVAACVQGEYEKGVLEVIGGRRGVIPHQLLTEAEMNAAPWPVYDEAVARRYFDRNPHGGRYPQAQVWASRGCPYKCIFCVWPATMTGNDPNGEARRSVRHYHASSLEPFLRSIISRYRYRSIYFDDDTFNLGNRHTLDMCAMMKKIGIPWSAMCRADTVKMETWEEMKKAGCYGVKLGFESGSQQVVDRIVNKHLDLAYASDVVRHLRKMGMTVHGTFTLGLPGETQAQVLETLRFIRSLPLNSHQISGTAEIEGTPLHALRTTGRLAQYAEARLDENYQREVDGNRKWQEMAAKLQES